MTFGERLKLSATKRYNNNLSAFLRDLSAMCNERNVRGCSRRTLYRYLADDTTPSQEWVEIAAQLLRVRVRWLRDGEGAPTHVEQAAADVAKRQGPWIDDAWWPDELRRQVEEVAPILASQGTPARVKAMLWEVAVRLALADLATTTVEEDLKDNGPRLSWLDKMEAIEYFLTALFQTVRPDASPAISKAPGEAEKVDFYAGALDAILRLLPAFTSARTHLEESIGEKG